jgi:type II secretory pathway pseudopilin PulG
MRGSMQSRRRDSQRGFALLVVFLMAAIVALMLYQQLPRVAFESEREKEQLLIDRGEQYTRAIQLYYLANNRTWPTSIDDLEKREKRFLRRRYVDPFTGKDEWRIIHTSGGFLTDSLVQKPPVTGNGQNQLAGNTTSNTTNLTASSTAGSTGSTDQQPKENAAV